MPSLKPLLVIALAACRGAATDPAMIEPDLAPVVAGLEPGDPYYAPQPHRDHPYAVVLSAGASKLYVALRGSDAEPGDQIAVIDARTLAPLRRIRVGLSPNDLALHPSGRWLLVANRFAAHLSVVDVSSDEVVSSIPTPYYATEIAFERSGARAFITNRWLDSVLVYDVLESDDGLALEIVAAPGARLRDRLRGHPGIPAGTNPRGLALDEDAGRLFVANPADLDVSVIDLGTLREIDRLFVGAPVLDVAVHRGTLFAATVGRGTGHPADRGPDTDRDGRPGDGTPNLHFHDLQNEIATFDVRSLEAGPRYTSDSITGFLDDAPDGPDLPSPDLRIVRGALPEQLAIANDRLYVVASGSGELGVYAIEPGRLSFVSRTFTGLFPYGVAVDPSTGAAFVANRLSEDVARIEPPGAALRAIAGDVEGGTFPATDAEIGEVFLHMTALYAVDGDATCNHCHVEGSAQRRVASAPHGKSPFTMRSTPTMRYLTRARPLMFENFLDETNFSPMMNEFGRAENFGPGNPRSDFPDRDTFYLSTSLELLGRDASVGDALEPTAIDFEGASKLLGLALIHEARALPNPNDPNTYAVERGKALFESAATGCAACHPAPELTLSEAYNPTTLPLGMRMFSPATFDGEDIDALKDTVKQKFGIEDHAFGVPTLRGLWDRPEHFYHDGRANSLIEALATPGHAALLPGEVGVNERDGVPDIHGGTSHLSPPEMSDLIEYLWSIE
jgi:DNA-binding beta-propeller fold protein YncE